MGHSDPPLIDPQSARVARPGRDRQHDQPPKYTPAEVDHRLSMDPGRFDAEGCWPSLSSQRVFHGGLPYWRVSCRHCRGSWRGTTESEAMGKARRAHGD